MPSTNYSSKVTWDAPRVTAATRSGAVRGTRVAAERLKALSVPLAPIDTSALRSSASTRSVDGPEPAALVVFATPYAAIQHENLDYQHDEGQAKYLEQPMAQHAAELQQIIAREVSVALLRA